MREGKATNYLVMDSSSFFIIIINSTVFFLFQSESTIFFHILYKVLVFSAYLFRSRSSQIDLCVIWEQVKLEYIRVCHCSVRRFCSSGPVAGILWIFFFLEVHFLKEELFK